MFKLFRRKKGKLSPAVLNYHPIFYYPEFFTDCKIVCMFVNKNYSPTEIELVLLWGTTDRVETLDDLYKLQKQGNIKYIRKLYYKFDTHKIGLPREIWSSHGSGSNQCTTFMPFCESFRFPFDLCAQTDHRPHIFINTNNCLCSPIDTNREFQKVYVADYNIFDGSGVEIDHWLTTQKKLIFKQCGT